METQVTVARPELGMILTIRANSERPGAGVTGKVVYIGPRFRSGDYLVTLELAGPVKWRDMQLHHIDAFMSELAASGQEAMHAISVNAS